MEAILPLAMGVDFHLDTFDEARDLSILHVAELTVKQGWQGRVCAGHMTALGALEPAVLAPIAAMIRDAGISVLALPATDLYLMGRGDTRNMRRGLAPVRRLAEAGVNVAVSTNNVQNPFTPWGDADLLRMANLLATVAHLGTVEDLSRAIRLRDYRLVEGARADLVLLDCREPAEAVAAIPERLYVIKDGTVSVENRVETIFARRT
jgi:cytosine deaminase